MPKTNFTEQLKTFLQQQAPEQVAEWLANTVMADKHLKKQWQIKLLLTNGKPSDYKKFLTQALPKKELICTPNLWRKVGMYFDDAETLFELAFENLDQTDSPLDSRPLNTSPLSNEQQFTWLMQAFERLNLVLQSMDDSGGYRLELEGQLSARLVQCFHQLDWPLEKKAAWLHEHEYKYDVFPYIPEQFELPAELAIAFAKQAQANSPDNVSMTLLERLKNGENE